MAELQDFVAVAMTRLEALTVFSTAGGVHLGIAPQEDTSWNAEFPYAVLNLQPSLGPQYATGGDEIDIRPVAIDIYANTAADALAAVESVEGDLDGTVLAPTTGTCIATHVGSSMCDLDPDRDEQGRDIWHATLIVEFTMQRSL